MAKSKGLEIKQIIAIRTDLKMGKGKIAAQASHASVLATLQAQRDQRIWYDAWFTSGMKKIVVKVSSEAELQELFQLGARAKLPRAYINDAGHTQLDPGTATAAALGPAPDSQLDPITQKYKLL
ncbi:MAG: peptidyl-tRNA hydrolase [Candidatus Heimdallarchaeota archaeon]|nr:peptidyl-tRNA hydrolase [Candidatus Heimdallarchaeota archaeon]